MAIYTIEISNEAGAVGQLDLAGGPALKRDIDAFFEAGMTLQHQRIEGDAKMVSAFSREGERVFRAPTSEWAKDLPATTAYVISMTLILVGKGEE